ncbi:MAG: hypothetical protein AAF604_03670 [Acidobacteriota bacterium]
MKRRSALLLVLAVLGWPATVVQPEEVSESSEELGSESPRRRSDTLFPTIDIDLPEGDLDLRASRLVGNIFFQGQVKYNFVDGDITAFLRYRVYGKRQTFQLTGFDSIEFESVEDVSGDFDRVRGLLGIFEWPHDYHRRSFMLLEVDRISSNREELRFNDNLTNTFVRFGYQIGTPDDPRSNAIVGESRARLDRLFTPHRAIGPRGAGLTAAATYGFDFLLGDFDYIRLELEGLKRFELPRGRFLVWRTHGGSFPRKKVIREGPDVPQPDRFSIPRSELFRLDGRENLKGLRERLRGTENLHTTAELFLPWFVDEERRALGLNWSSWYWVLYGGYGTIGYDRDVLTDVSEYYPDLGIGIESSFELKGYTIFLSAVIAQTLRGDSEPEAKLSIKSYR